MFTVIENILPEEQAKYLSEQAYATDLLWRAYKINDELPVYEKLPYDMEPAILRDSFHNSEFTYTLKRTQRHPPECECFHCDFRNNTLKAQWFKDIIIRETSLKQPYIHEDFTSLYEQGDFLGLHSDRAMDCAFILHLTPEWRPEYGGLLNIRQEDGTYTTLCPKFNSLVLIDLNQPNGIPHFVSEVTHLAPHGRVAISGWYNENTTNSNI